MRFIFGKHHPYRRASRRERGLRRAQASGSAPHPPRRLTRAPAARVPLYTVHTGTRIEVVESACCRVCELRFGGHTDPWGPVSGGPRIKPLRAPCAVIGKFHGSISPIKMTHLSVMRAGGATPPQGVGRPYPIGLRHDSPFASRPQEPAFSNATKASRSHAASSLGRMVPSRAAAHDSSRTGPCSLM